MQLICSVLSSKHLFPSDLSSVGLNQTVNIKTDTIDNIVVNIKKKI